MLILHWLLARKVESIKQIVGNTLTVQKIQWGKFSDREKVPVV